VHPRACQLDFAGKRGLPRTDESIRHTAPSLIFGGPLLPSINAADHPLTNALCLLIFASLPALFGRVSAV
jgi:hypothetical protein